MKLLEKMLMRQSPLLCRWSGYTFIINLHEFLKLDPSDDESSSDESPVPAKRPRADTYGASSTTSQGSGNLTEIYLDMSNIIMLFVIYH